MSKISCSYGAKCTRKECECAHPEGRDEMMAQLEINRAKKAESLAKKLAEDQAAKAESLAKKAEELAKAARDYKERTPCRRGVTCKIRSCEFWHPVERETFFALCASTPCRYGNSCSRQETCVYLHPLVSGVPMKDTTTEIEVGMIALQL